MRKKKREVFKNISNKLAYTLIAICIVILLGIGVTALYTNNPTNFGHSMGEMLWPSCAANGYVLTWNSGAWVCAAPSAGSTGTAVYQCPVMYTPATNYCANVQMTRNGIGPCLGQLQTGLSCFAVDINCAYSSTEYCTLIGHLMP